MSRDGAFSCTQQTKNWCVGFSFPPPAYAGIHPTLYLFGFRANALNSHSPSLCLALTFLGLFPGCSGPSRASGGLRGPQAPPGALPQLPGLRGLPDVWLRAGGLRGPPGPPGASGLFFEVRMLGLVVGFASFLGCQPCSCLTEPEIPAFPGHLQGRPGQWAPKTTPSPRPRSLGLGFLNNLVNHRKGEGVP